MRLIIQKVCLMVLLITKKVALKWVVKSNLIGLMAKQFGQNLFRVYDSFSLCQSVPC